MECLIEEVAKGGDLIFFLLRQLRFFDIWIFFFLLQFNNTLFSLYLNIYIVHSECLFILNFRVLLSRQRREYSCFIMSDLPRTACSLRHIHENLCSFFAIRHCCLFYAGVDYKRFNFFLIFFQHSHTHTKWTLSWSTAKRAPSCSSTISSAIKSN